MKKVGGKEANSTHGFKAPPPSWESSAVEGLGDEAVIL
jgi:hypothetical protein